jgi:hypothetical protein
LQNKEARKDPNPSGCKNTRTRAQNPKPVLTLTLAHPKSSKKEAYLTTRSSQLHGQAMPRLSSPGDPPSSHDRRIPSHPELGISSAPRCVGQLAAPSPLDGGALTSRRAHSPARRPAAAPHLLAAVAWRKEEEGEAAAGARGKCPRVRATRAPGVGFDPPKTPRDRRMRSDGRKSIAGAWAAYGPGGALLCRPRPRLRPGARPAAPRARLPRWAGPIWAGLG